MAAAPNHLETQKTPKMKKNFFKKTLKNHQNQSFPNRN